MSVVRYIFYWLGAENIFATILSAAELVALLSRHATVMLPTVLSILVMKIFLCVALCSTLLTQMSCIEPTPKSLYCNLIWTRHSVNILVPWYCQCLVIVNSFVYSVFTFMAVSVFFLTQRVKNLFFSTVFSMFKLYVWICIHYSVCCVWAHHKAY